MFCVFVQLARQLTLMEAEYFNAIKPWELLNLAWSRKGKEEKAPNVLVMIGHSNTLSPYIGIQARARLKHTRAHFLLCVESNSSPIDCVV